MVFEQNPNQCKHSTVKIVKISDKITHLICSVPSCSEIVAVWE